MGTQNMILFLKQEHAARAARNPGYSLRAFALFLQVDHSLLAKIFRGERNLSKNMSFKVGEKLGLSVEEVQDKLDMKNTEIMIPAVMSAVAYA